MNQSDLTTFFQNVIQAGSILAGFSATFLAFRIGREAEYYRSPEGNTRDQQHFTSSFLLIILATAAALVSGFLLPLFFLAGMRGRCLHPRVIVAGLLATVILLCGYFMNELLHYRLLKNIDTDWRAERPVRLTTLVMAGLIGTVWLIFGWP
jgi:sterol desaturase/sphingolipid hydroxylase (fatty acid hydroxylase superfamily)